MTFNDYIQNPMGVKNAVFSQREMYRALYTDKLNKIYLREAGYIKYFLYKDKERYFIHVKVPSEVIEKFYYDTIIEFHTDREVIKLSNQLNDYYVNFYSNDPSFVYTFAHAFLKNNIFIKDLVPKMSKQAVLQAAKEKNPKNVVGYVKSIYFAYIIIKNRGLMKKVNFDSYGKKFDLKYVLSTIEHADSKVLKRKQAGEELNKKKHIDKVRQKVDKNNSSNDSNITKLSKNIRNTSMIKTITSGKNTKKTNIIKRK